MITFFSNKLKLTKIPCLPLQQRIENTARPVCTEGFPAEFQYYFADIDIFESDYVRVLRQCVHIATSVRGDVVFQFPIRFDVVLLDGVIINGIRMYGINEAYRRFSIDARRQRAFLCSTVEKIEKIP